MSQVIPDQTNKSSLHQLYLSRLEKTRNAMKCAGIPVMLIVDPVNIFYITGASNMTIFSIRTPSRYLLLFAEGPCILFDYFGCEHLSQELPTIDEIRPALGLCFVSANQKLVENAKHLASEIQSLVQSQGVEIGMLAIGRFPYPVVDAFRTKGFVVSDADAIMHSARSTKLAIELPYMREAMRRAEQATLEFERAIEPGKTETEVWAEFHKGLIGGGGKYISTRLMQSGENTFPYFQECGPKLLQKGDLICLDTDAIGYEGYAVDFSRTFLCGDQHPTTEQTTLYQRAKDQLEHNIALIQPGASYAEVANKAWKIPEQHQDSRYYCIGHGLGMSGEYPNIPHETPGEKYPIEGHLEPGMMICVESYIGSKATNQGVKLEEQLLLTDSGAERISQYCYDDRFDAN